MNFFERKLLFEYLETSLFQPINLSNAKVKRERDQVIENILKTPPLRKDEGFVTDGNITRNI